LSAIDRLMTVITVVHSCRLQTRLQAHQRFVSDAFLESLDITTAGLTTATTGLYCTLTLLNVDWPKIASETVSQRFLTGFRKYKRVWNLTL